MVLGRRFVLKHHFEGNPKREDFDLVEEELPPLKVSKHRGVNHVFFSSPEAFFRKMRFCSMLCS